MIAPPTQADLGRRAIYRPDAEPEEGVISSLVKLQPTFVFVRFRGPTGELTHTSKLEWADDH